MKHKWHDEIVAWADGAEIEFHAPNGWETVDAPKWHIDCEYRIKAQPKQPKYLYVYYKNGFPIDISPVKWISDRGYSYLGKIEVLDD